MRWVSVTSERPELKLAIDDAASRLTGLLGGPPDLVLAFLGGYPAEQCRLHAGYVHEALPDAELLGCTAGAVIGGGVEIEGGPAVSLVGAHLPGVQIVPFHLAPSELEPGRLSAESWARHLGLRAEHQPSFLLLPDPLTTDIERLLGSLDLAYPRSPKVGGLASGARPPDRNQLLLGDLVASAGVVGLALVGDLVMDTVVAQGCRPLGQPMTITRAERHVIHQLDGQPALEAFDAFYAGLSPMERALFQRGPLLGVCIDPAREGPRRGDFLVRSLLGMDRQRGAIGVGALLRAGQVVQFHARDARTSSEDLHELVARYHLDHAGETPRGALLFSCLGRGLSLYGVHDHDSRVLRETLGDLPLGGFFCAGEIGPIHGRTFLHGYTSSVALFRSRGWD